MLKIFLALALCGLGFAQTPPVSLRNAACASPTEPLVAITVPVSLSGVTVPVPVCVGLGTGLRLNANSTKIEADSGTPFPRQVLHSVPLAGLEAATVTFNLQFAPAPGTFFIVSYTSSRIGGDVLDFIPFAGGDQPKSITLTLPLHRPLLATDVVKILYWTLEPPPA